MNTIIILCDVAETDQLLIVQAEELAKALGSKIYLLHVAAPNPDFVGYDVGPQHERDWRAETLKHERNLLHENAVKLQGSGITSKAILLQGSTQEKVIDEVKLLEPDLVVVGNHKHSFFYRIFIGNVGEGIANKINCPVLLVPLP